MSPRGLMSFKPKSELLTILIERGFVQNLTNQEQLDYILNREKIASYIGYDATAESLHVGHLVNIMMLRWTQKCGHTPITLMGGGTTKVGDPSFRSADRPLLSENKIINNINSLNKIFDKYLDYENVDNKAIMVNNSDWLENLNYLNFLRDIGRHFSVNRMLTFESIKSRIDREQSLSFLEFNYMILQAYDFLELNKKKNCTLQIGGSDQWGNIVNGVELIKRYSGNQVYGLTTPLITLASGAKMGKTEQGAVWLDKKLLSPYDYWQFWRNTDDRDVIKFLKMFTDLKIDEISKKQNDNINDLKILLANHATTMLHGEDESKKCFEQAKKIFLDKSSDEGLPIIKISKNEIANKYLSDLILNAKLENSKSEIKRLIQNKGIKVNNSKVEKDQLVSNINLNNKNHFKLSIGKKKHFKIELN